MTARVTVQSTFCALATEVDLGVFGLFTFKKEFFWWANEGSESSVDSNLVAAGSLSESKEWFAENGEPIIAALDDFLLVCSLGTRTRTSCIGWKAAGNGGMITRYRPDISIPSGYSLPNLNDGLVDQTDFQEFARKTFAQLIASADVTALRAAIYAVVPSAPRLLESDFVALFSAVEELLLAYSRRQDMQTILPDEKWLHLSNDIKSIIKAALPSDKSARSLMYAKIGELNRAPTRAIYESFMAEYGIDTSDLWPMFGSAQGATLYDIRNWISHGEHLPRAVQDQLWIATEHLKWTVERILLTRLAWPIEKSEVRMNLLAMHSTAIRDLDVARAAITYSMKSCKVIP